MYFALKEVSSPSLFYYSVSYFALTFLPEFVILSIARAIELKWNTSNYVDYEVNEVNWL